MAEIDRNRTADARAGLRLDRQYVIGIVDARHPAARGLCLGQGGDRRLHQYARPGAGAAPHPGQRDRTTVLTERQRQLWFQTEAQVEAARAAQCLPDLIAPDDIANLALFLASDDSRLITKQTISVNAGVL